MRTEHVGTCSTCAKKVYPDRKAARRTANRIPADGEHRPRAYRCPHQAGWWHIGHLPEAVRRGVIDRNRYRQNLP